MFKAVEFDRESMKETGTILYFSAQCVEDAVQSCLYTKRLSNCKAMVGPTGRCVYSGDKCYAIIPA